MASARLAAAVPYSAASLLECLEHQPPSPLGQLGKKPAPVLLARLRSAPPGVTDPARTAAGRDAVLALVAVLKTLGAARKDLDRSVKTQLAAHSDGHIFTSLPRSGQVNAAQLLAEWGDARGSYNSPDSVAAFAGVAPVTKASCRMHNVAYRWACNKRFRQALTGFADRSRHASPWAAGIYARARAQGKDHPHAVRVLARAWVRVIYRCWLDGVPYDPTKHGAANALTKQTITPSAA